MDYLSAFYKRLVNNPNRTDFPEIERIPATIVYYARAAIRERLGRELSLEVVADYLKTEGFLGWSEYGVPNWFVKKYS